MWPVYRWRAWGRWRGHGHRLPRWRAHRARRRADRLARALRRDRRLQVLAVVIDVAAVLALLLWGRQ